MLRARTVFVVGAGASFELDLPVGEGLKQWIVDALKLDPNHYDQHFADPHVNAAVLSYVMEHEPSQQRYVLERFENASSVISKALPFALSIDQYLDSQRANPEIVQLGKIGIASSILQAEYQSKIGTSKGKQALSIRDISFQRDFVTSWHYKLVQLLTAGRPKEDAHRVFDDVAFIVFNYDRCLEQYFKLALTAYYDDAALVDQAMRSLRVVHPYGQVGAMPWQDGVMVPFGGKAEGRLRNVADEILTFTESARSGVVNDVKQMVEGAESIVLMGFGYLPQNIDLLTVRAPSNAMRVFNTSFGISDSDKQFVDDDISTMLQKPHYNNYLHESKTFRQYDERGTCSDLMRNHWMRLTRQ